MHTFKMPSPNSILLNCRTNLVPTEVRRVEISKKKKYDNKRNGYVLGWLKAVTSNPSILAVHFNSSLFFYFSHMGFPISFCSKWSRNQEFWKFLREFRNLPSSSSTITPEKGRPWTCAYYFCPHSTGWNSVLCPRLPAWEVGKYSLVECPGGKGSGIVEHISLCYNKNDSSFFLKLRIY